MRFIALSLAMQINLLTRSKKFSSRIVRRAAELESSNAKAPLKSIMTHSMRSSIVHNDSLYINSH